MYPVWRLELTADMLRKSTGIPVPPNTSLWRKEPDFSNRFPVGQRLVA